jgi:Cof subfamily protein (haloacid dehalogenase superfamily)
MLTPETLRTVRAVGLDVDGTLSHDDHVIPERTIHALRRVSELGLPVFLLTGRARRNVLELAREIGLTNLVVSNNGAITFDPVEDTNVVFRPMDHEMVRSIVDLGHELGMDVTWWTEHDIYVEHHGPISDMLTDLNETDILVGDSTNLPDDVTKVMLFGTKDLLDTHRSTVLEKFPEAARSMYCFYEFVAEDSNKWNALSDLLERYSIAPETVLGMGDGGNDIPFLSRIGVPVAMGNARDSVKAVAKAVAPSNEEDGVAVILEQLADAHESAA